MLAESENQLTLRVINGLYVEAMVLADEARAYFDQASHDMRDRMPPLIRVTFSCESLKVTTRLMHVVAWLLSQRALAGKKGYFRETARLGTAVDSDSGAITALPAEAQRIIHSTIELYGRVRRLDGNMQPPTIMPSPARQLQSRLASLL